LGGAYSRHITEQGFDPEAFIRSVDHQAWLQNRLALSHDVYHVITGFDGSPVGEFGLAAFTLVQYRDLLNTFVLSFVPWSMLGFPRQAGKMLAAIGQGFRMGWRCRPIVAYPFEDNWHKPLWLVRQELGIA
jgi:ubiquinone biosynthesis protein Coq4